MHQFLHFGIHKNAYTIAQNALILQLLGGVRPDIQRGPATCTRTGGTAPRPTSPLEWFSGSATAYWVTKYSLQCQIHAESLYIKGKGGPYSIAEHRVPELIPVLGSQPAGDVSHKPGITFRQACSYPHNPQEGCYQFCCLVKRGTMGVNSLPKTVTRQRRDCDLNPDTSAPESSTLTTRLPSLLHCTQHTRNYSFNPSHLVL